MNLKSFVGACLAFLFCWCGAAPTLYAAEFQVAPVPAWVLPLTAPVVDKPASNARQGEQSLLSDVQVRIEAVGKTHFQHYASKALDSKGVRGAADISVTFDPTYEKVTLHTLKVIRGSQVIEKLDSASIHVLQREKELEYQVLDGSKTLSVVLDDVRVGDIVEYAYSRSGVNPIFRNQIVGGEALQWGVPVAHAAVRLLVPAGRSLTISSRNNAPAAQVAALPGYREYRWDQLSVPAMRVEDGAPDSYDPYASVQWSEFPDWASVVRWGLPLYQVPPQLGPELTAAIQQIKRSAPSPEARLLAVLQLVQRDIRYLGVEVGQGGFQPRPPDLVFQRRFGDCKDKALLTVTMLRALGVSAAPALVNTTLEEAVKNFLPSAGVFNHVVVRAWIGDRHYWIDPTRSLQSGDLAHLTQADQGVALVLESGSKDLMSMRVKGAERSRLEVLATFDASAGRSHPVTYTIRTTAHGTAAESRRQYLAASSTEEVQAKYLNYYARRYHGIKLASPMTVTDDALQNRITTTESYLIDDFWAPPKDGGRPTAYVRGSEIRSRLYQPDELNRIAPLALNFVGVLEERTEVKLPGDWDVTPAKVSVDDPAFEFRHETMAGSGAVTYVLTDYYRALKREVPASDVRAYAANLTRAYDSVGLTLYLGAAAEASAAKHQASYAVPVGALGLLIVWSLLIAACLHSPPAHQPHNWYLFRHVVWVSGAIWMLLTAFPAGWKSRSLALVALYIGSRLMTKHHASAPATHWLHDVGSLASRNQRPVGGRLLIRGFLFVPVMLEGVAVLAYVKSLLA
jgi:transglutaminase-like putative cysteine protease